MRLVFSFVDREECFFHERQIRQRQKPPDFFAFPRRFVNRAIVFGRINQPAVANADDGNVDTFRRVGEARQIPPVPALVHENINAFPRKKFFEERAVFGARVIIVRQKELPLRICRIRAIFRKRKVKYAVPAASELIRKHRRHALHSAAFGINRRAV